MDIKSKVAIVTGASSGIGYATAKLLSKNGAKVALVARSKNKLEKLAKELPGSIAIVADMTEEIQVKAMVRKTSQHFGRIDILINNAGRGYDAPITDINLKRIHYLFDLDLAGPLIAMQQVIPVMRNQGGGAIVNISSGTALMFLPNMSAYSSLKRALVGISLTAREELKEDNIIVSVVYPYITSTDFEKNTLKDGKLPDWEGENDGDMEPPDSAEYVAERILDGIKKGQAEIFAHDWMKRMS